MIHRFTGVLLNEKGYDKAAIEEKTPTGDEYYRAAGILIETGEIESVFPIIKKQLGQQACQIRLKSGDTYDVLDSIDRIQHLLMQERVIFN